MIRITTGTAKNKKLQVPNIESIRAVQEIAKLAIFAILENRIINAECLDLYAGSGNLGLEALSRGAKHCDFVERHPVAIKAIENNVNSCSFQDKATITRKDAIKFVANTEKSYDVIFADPFYDDTSHIFLMENLEEILKPEGTLVFLHGENLDIVKNLKNTQLKIETQRNFGKGFFTFITH